MTQVESNTIRSGSSVAYKQLRQSLLAFGQGLRTALHVYQTARMMQALNALSDRQLAEIGIERRDIPCHAERMMSETEGKSARGNAKTVLPD